MPYLRDALVQEEILQAVQPQKPGRKKRRMNLSKT